MIFSNESMKNFEKSAIKISISKKANNSIKQINLKKSTKKSKKRAVEKSISKKIKRSKQDKLQHDTNVVDATHNSIFT